VLGLFDIIVFHGHGFHLDYDQGSIMVGHFRIDFCKSKRQFTVKWGGEIVPETFLEFQKEWDRVLNLKAFW
jgi:hypothetical protein